MGTKQVRHANSSMQTIPDALTPADAEVEVRVSNSSLRAAITERCTPEKIATALADGLTAKKKFYSRATGLIEVEDHDIRLKAVKLAAQLAYDAKLASDGDTTINMVINSLQGVLGRVELK